MASLTTKINIVGTSSTLVTMKTSSTNYKDFKCQKTQNDKKHNFWKNTRTSFMLLIFKKDNW